jgi:hypothetical protein
MGLSGIPAHNGSGIGRGMNDILKKNRFVNNR